jgi:murein DD-endopeptidase MepM/ murein hydrolase activator NlpD
MKRTSVLSALSFIFLLLVFSPLHAQFRTEIFGTAAPGYVLVGHAQDIKSILFENRKVNFSADGWFIVGFDRDANGLYRLKINFNDKKTESFDYTVDVREYETQRINGLQKQMVIPPKKARARISEESAIIAAQKKKLLTDKSDFFSKGFITPVDSPVIHSVFGSGRVLNGVKKNPHNGIDYAGEAGDSVKAACDGTVILAEHNFYYNGSFIMISHGLGLYTIYLHLSKVNVKRGDKVLAGDIIGEIGSTGRSTGPHLHFGAQLFNIHIDPAALLQFKISTGGPTKN